MKRKIALFLVLFISILAASNNVSEAASKKYVKVGSYKVYYSMDKKAIHIDVSCPRDWKAIMVYNEEVAEKLIDVYIDTYDKNPTVSEDDLAAEIRWHADLTELTTDLINDYNDYISSHNFINGYQYEAYQGLVNIRKHSQIADCVWFPKNNITEIDSPDDVIELLEKKGYTYNELYHADSKEEFLEILGEIWTK